jgi:hypothetical protein
VVAASFAFVLFFFIPEMEEGADFSLLLLVL